VALGERREVVQADADARMEELQSAVTRSRSMQRLLDRIDDAAREVRRRREAAELQDLVTARAVRNGRMA
jgi:hypothetical protein